MIGDKKQEMNGSLSVSLGRRTGMMKHLGVLLENIQMHVGEDLI